MRGKSAGAHRPLPRERICTKFPYLSIVHQNIKMCCFGWMALNASRFLSGESASIRLKKRVNFTTCSKFYDLFKVDQFTSKRPSYDRYFPDFEHALRQYAV